MCSSYSTMVVKRWPSNILTVVIPASSASTTQNIGCLSIVTPSKMSKTKVRIIFIIEMEHILCAISNFQHSFWEIIKHPEPKCFWVIDKNGQNFVFLYIFMFFFFYLVPTMSLKVRQTKVYHGGLMAVIDVPISYDLEKWRIDILFPRQVFDLKVCFVRSSRTRITFVCQRSSFLSVALRPVYAVWF